MGYHKSLQEVLKNAAHYVALGDTTIFLDDDDPDLPWGEVSAIEEGNGYRLHGPTGFRCVAKRDGLTLKWHVDFEGREANGKGYSMFDRERMRRVMSMLPLKARAELAAFMESKVLPGVTKITAEWREALNKQLDSEDCVRGLIAFARS